MTFSRKGTKLAGPIEALGMGLSSRQGYEGDGGGRSG